MRDLKMYPIARALASPFLPARLLSRPGSGGTGSAEYCYSVWMRHWKSIADLGLFTHWGDFRTVAEIGPGDTLGIGLSALYSGFDRYYGFDVIDHANKENNIGMANALAIFFKQKKAIPDGSGLANVKPALDDYDWPEHLVRARDESIDSLKSKIVEALKGDREHGITVDYHVPWDKSLSMLEQDVDLIFSQAVMEHVDDIQTAYSAMFKYLRPGGIISHQVDFQTHEMTHSWNGHWYIGDRAWRFLHSYRKYPLNRLPLSAHLGAIENAGFEVKCVKKAERANENKDRSPVVPNVSFNKEDLVTAGAYIVAQKPE